jgi:hypothetical protein
MNHIEAIIDVLRNAAFITGLVIVLLFFIEYAGALLGAKRRSMPGKSAALQTVAAALVGMIPGCIGGFALVSLFVRGSVGFGALLAALIASMGDEALAMLSLFPRQALILQAILLVIAVPMGLLANKYCKNLNFVTKFQSSTAHTHHCNHNIHSNILQNIRHITVRRAVLMTGLVLFIVAVISGVLQHSHNHELHTAPHNFFWDEHWINWLFAALAVVALIMVAAADTHFVDKHLWQHIIQRHFVKIFLWALGALAVVAVLDHYIEAQAWVSQNQWLMLAAALLVGIIPASGPHLVFVVMFAGGSITFPVLLANMLVQDGHAGMLLAATSKRTFVFVKIIKIVLAAMIGILCSPSFF